MSFTGKNIYGLLPSIYRVRDSELDGPLQAFISVIASQAKITEDNITNLYNNWFIETCDEWVVPYIGDLLGVRNLNPISGSNAISQRAYVANTISYRRRKGIAPVLEQLALDVSGWRAHVTEFFQLLITSQYMNHIRIQRTITPDMRMMDQLDLINSPFETAAHTADMRHISSGHGKYNIPNIGIFVWRLQSYPVVLSDARQIQCLSSPPSSPPRSAGQFFSFDPLGNNTQLFNRPQSETEITHISTEINVPAFLRRRALFDELEARRQALVNGLTPEYAYFDDQLAIEDDPSSKKHCIFEIIPGGSDQPVPPEEILIGNLQNCCTPPVKKTYQKLMPDGSFSVVDMPITVVADPVTGRFLFTGAGPTTKARVSYSYGFSGDTGCGSYNRQDTIPAAFQSTDIWQAGVSQTIPAEGTEQMFTTIADALAVWNGKPAGTIGVITVMDSRSYPADLDITLKEKSQLLLIAADWPVQAEPDTLPPVRERMAGDLAAAGLRPHIKGDISITGFMPDGSGNTDTDKKTGGQFTINGFLVEGKIAVLKGNLSALTCVCCTLVPGMGGMEAGADTTDVQSNQWLTILISRSICGPVDLNITPVVSLEIDDSIIDHSGGLSIDASKAPVIIQRSTIFGKTSVKTIEAGNAIFTDTINAERRQTGCIRFSFLPLKDSLTPRRFRCQPEMEITSEIADAQKSAILTQPQIDEIQNEVLGWLVPTFTSQVFGNHGYSQLSYTCPVQISAGDEGGSEMGAFSNLKQPQRAANLRITLDEYLPLGLETGILYVS
jgi:hypothetical protein